VATIDTDDATTGSASAQLWDHSIVTSDKATNNRAGGVSDKIAASHF
jgi:hypothetical protein